jgi:uncharacterized membrane protein
MNKKTEEGIRKLISGTIAGIMIAAIIAIIAAGSILWFAIGIVDGSVIHIVLALLTAFMFCCVAMASIINSIETVSIREHDRTIKKIKKMLKRERNWKSITESEYLLIKDDTTKNGDLKTDPKSK